MSNAEPKVIDSSSVRVTLPLPASPATRAAVSVTAGDLLSLLGSTPQGLTSADVQRLFGVSERVAQGRLRELLSLDARVVRVKEGRSYRYLLEG